MTEQEIIDAYYNGDAGARAEDVERQIRLRAKDDAVAVSRQPTRCRQPAGAWSPQWGP
jgi:hypothetical protein